MNSIWLERSAITLALIFVARTVGRFRGAKKQQAALRTPLVDAAVLEAVFHPRLKDGDEKDGDEKDGDDPALLAELRDMFAHLNRQAWAEQFWGLHTQITALSQTLGPAQDATLRRAILRLLASNERWLQLVAAKAASDLGMAEAVPALQALLRESDAADARIRSVLADALAALTAPVPHPP